MGPHSALMVKSMDDNSAQVISYGLSDIPVETLFIEFSFSRRDLVY